MRLLFIKIGKAFSTLKRDGFIRGGRRILSAFLAMFKLVGKGDVLFITGGVGDSARYRTDHIAEELQLQGLECSITVQDNPLITGYANKFKIFIFHRVLFTPSIKKLIEKIKKQNKEIIFETDDLVYNPKYLQYMDYFKKMNVFEKKLYENGVGGEILSDQYIKVCTTSTPYLADKLKEEGKKVFIIPNKLSNEDLTIIGRLKSKILPVTGDKLPIRLGYFSGTSSHDKDFATISDALMQIMKKYPNVELLLVGPLNIKNNLDKFKERIKQLSYVPRKKHFENIALVDINLAPLEIGNPFCEAKSELKFFEAGIIGVPTVASATQTFCEAIEDGIDGFVANGTSEWIDKLEKLIMKEDLRMNMGKRAREKSLQKYTTRNGCNEEYYNYLKTKV